MKKQYLLLSLLCLAAFIPACDKDESDYPSYISFATVAVPAQSSRNYYFVLDDGATVYPSDKDRIMYNANGKNGNRAVIYYNFLASSVPGFDHNIALYDVVDITSKEIVMADNAGSLLTLGDSPVGIDEARSSGDWLDICCYYPAQNATSSAENRISLVDNRTVQPPTEMPQGYTYLELRLKTNGETSPLNIRRSCISYRLGEYGSASTGGKGLYLKVVPPDGEPTYLQLDYDLKTE